VTEPEGYYERGLAGGRNTLDARQFWSAAAVEELIIQHCGGCERYIFPPQELCPHCWAEDLVWTEVSGEGTVHSYSTIHVPLHDAWADRVPYTVAFVRLEEGVFLLTALLDCPPDSVSIDMPVEVTFAELPEETGLFPCFRPG
jgi:uncharacterized OB-fold protein